MRFELEQNNRGASDEDLLTDIRRCASELGANSITGAQYERVGRFGLNTIKRRLGSWTKALQLADLQTRTQRDFTDEELFENFKSLWINLGRQPRYSEVKRPESTYSMGCYVRRFGSLTESLRRFIEWVNSDDPVPSFPEHNSDATSGIAMPRVSAEISKRRTRRDPSERQRFRILVRDGFRCNSCGASPLVRRGVELNVDHILPWSKGGETIDENLETKCTQCNLGKGAAFHV